MMHSNVCSIYQGWRAIVKMTQLLLQSSSFQEHGSSDAA